MRTWVRWGRGGVAVAAATVVSGLGLAAPVWAQDEAPAVPVPGLCGETVVVPPHTEVWLLLAPAGMVSDVFVEDGVLPRTDDPAQVAAVPEGCVLTVDVEPGVPVPAVNPPAGAPPAAVTPPAVIPPAVIPPAVTSPAVTSPAVTPPTSAPPAAEPTATPPVAATRGSGPPELLPAPAGAPGPAGTLALNAGPAPTGSLAMPRSDARTDVRTDARTDVRTEAPSLGPLSVESAPADPVLRTSSGPAPAGPAGPAPADTATPTAPPGSVSAPAPDFFAPVPATLFGPTNAGPAAEFGILGAATAPRPTAYRTASTVVALPTPMAPRPSVLLLTATAALLIVTIVAGRTALHASRRPPGVPHPGRTPNLPGVPAR